jgi:hypothetical protein
LELFVVSLCGESGSKVLAYRYDFLLCFSGWGKSSIYKGLQQETSLIMEKFDATCGIKGAVSRVFWKEVQTGSPIHLFFLSSIARIGIAEPACNKVLWQVLQFLYARVILYATRS